jgi:hypothetical protein
MTFLDRREVEFDAAALIAVVVTSQQAAESLGLPGIVPHAVHFHPEAGEIAFLYGTVQTPQVVRLKAAAVGALLVSYCIRLKVPMPRKAGKGVRIEVNSVILFFRVEFSQDIKPTTSISWTSSAAPAASWTWGDPERVPTDHRLTRRR